MFAEKVYYYHSQEAPDDTEYSTQQSLESSTYANGNINIEPAWDVVEGSEDILIGVFDSGIRWSHEDRSFKSTVLYRAFFMPTPADRPFRNAPPGFPN